MLFDQECLCGVWHNHNSKLFFKPIIAGVVNYFILANKLNGKLLDLGCGNGEKAYALSKIGFDVTGLDYDAARLEIARKQYSGVDFRLFHIRHHLPFMDNTFDVIFSNSVFQYIDHVSIIRECKRILKPDGCIILIENLKNNPVTKIGRAFRKMTGFQYQSYPYNHFTKHEINSLKYQFNNAVLNYFHFLTPLAHLKGLTHLYSILRKTDQFILQYPVIQRYSWIAMFAALNKK